MALTGNQIGILHGDVQKTAFQTPGQPLLTAPSTFSYSSNDLEAAIYDYLAQHNEQPKPFKWTKTAEDILTRERRALDKLDDIRGNR